MTPVKNKSTLDITRSMCGRTGCIAIYRTDNCHLCDAAGDFLKELIREEGFSENSIKVIEHDYQLNEPNFDDILSRPAIRVCDTVVTGFPDNEKMRNTLRRAASMNCFSEDAD